MAETITFNKVDQEYVATFEAKGDFALHIERAEAGPISMGITSVEGGQYAQVDSFPATARHKQVIDYGFAGVGVLLYVQIKSATQPTMAVVTFAE